MQVIKMLLRSQYALQWASTPGAVINSVCAVLDNTRWFLKRTTSTLPPPSPTPREIRDEWAAKQETAAAVAEARAAVAREDVARAEATLRRSERQKTSSKRAREAEEAEALEAAEGCDGAEFADV